MSNIEGLSRDALKARIKDLELVLLPFAEFADPKNRMPSNLPITNGSSLARRQLTMGDCYRARAALPSQHGSKP